jgi:hypothetical protein
LVRQRREERDADVEFLQPVLAPGDTVIEGDGAVVDLDIVEGESGRWPLRGIERAIDQVLDVVASVASARERERGTYESHRVEYGRPSHDGFGRCVGDEFVEREHWRGARAAGNRNFADRETQLQRIELDGFDRRRAAESLREPRLELRAGDRRDDEPREDDQRDEHAQHDRHAAQPAAPRRFGGS